MTSVTLLPAAGRAKAPWKNGGGVTQTVAAYPDDAGPDAFLWRVSIAEVRSAGPFSIFPETDRHLSVLGGSLLLDVTGRLATTLSADSAGLAFPGDVEASGTPIGGPVLDLNVMTRRGQFCAQVERLQPEASVSISAEVALLVATAATQIECPGAQLECLDALRITNGIGWHLAIKSARPVHLIQISFAPGPVALGSVRQPAQAGGEV